MTTKSQTRAEEFNQLLVVQGHATRSMRYDGGVGAEQQKVISDRARRLVELAELLPGVDRSVPPERYVNDRLAAWLKMNPLALTNARLVVKVLETTKTQNPDTSSTCGVFVQVGEGGGAYSYRLMADDLAAVRNGQHVTFQVPESVAEHFRQQGRRELQSEMRGLLNVSRA